MIVNEWHRGLVPKLRAYSPVWTTEQRSPLARLLYERPQPLIDPINCYGVLRSAKGASKAVMLWYLARLEMLKPASGRGRAHRLHVLKKTELQRQARNCDPMKLRWLRIIRDPYNRTVSSYRHALGHGYEDEKIQETVDISVAERGLSFKEFLDYLANIDIATCDNHHMQQWHPLEAHVALSKVINLDKEPLLPALDAFAAHIGLPPMREDMRATMLADWEHESRRHHKAHNVADDGVADIRFSREQASGSWPDYQAFLTSETRDKIERIYAKDFAAYRAYL
jgi:hypothetical protein